MKTRELTDAGLDWAACKGTGLLDAYPQYAAGAKFLKLWSGNSAKYVHPSTDWAHGGPIIAREKIRVGPTTLEWYATKDGYTVYGLTPLIAAIRCFVLAKLGDEVEIPKELT